jgi:carbon monoxide dehydrogenase subunit G
MEFNDTFTLEDVTMEEVWMALSDPEMIKEALPGCQFLVEVEDDDPDFDALLAEAQETDEDVPILPDADPDDVAARAFKEGGKYAAVMQLSVGSVKPTFETVVTIEHREFPEMRSSGKGSASDSSFEMNAGMELREIENGVEVDWWAETSVFGRIANMGQRVISPVANRVINRFFKKVQKQLQDVGDESGNLRDRIKSYF